MRAAIPIASAAARVPGVGDRTGASIAARISFAVTRSLVNGACGLDTGRGNPLLHVRRSRAFPDRPLRPAVPASRTRRRAQDSATSNRASVRPVRRRTMPSRTVIPVAGSARSIASASVRGANGRGFDVGMAATRGRNDREDATDLLIMRMISNIKI